MIDIDIIARESLEREAEAIASGVFDISDVLPDLGFINDIPASCPICRLRILVCHTISAHRWGFMVQGYCGHIFPASLA